MNMRDNDSQVVEQYKSFMKIDSFPTFTTEYYDLEKNATYSRIARAEYSSKDGTYKLLLPRNISMPKFILFHELTHIFDTDKYKNGNQTHDCCLSGYMEYHAAQIELMKIVGFETVETVASFSMEDSIAEMNETVRQYVNNKLEIAQSLIESHETKEKIDGIGASFNFFGLKSICSMYATDYTDDYIYQRVSMYMSTQLLFCIRTFMTGWIKDVDKAVCLYSNVVAEVLG